MNAAVHIICHINPAEPVNISILFASEFTQAAQGTFEHVTFDTPHFKILPLKDVAILNTLVILATLDTFHFEMSPSNDVTPLNILVIRVLDTYGLYHFEMLSLNATAPRNIVLMSIALDTTHFERSALKHVVPANMALMMWCALSGPTRVEPVTTNLSK